MRACVLLLASMVCLLLPEIAAARTLEEFDVRGWNVSANADDDTGAFSSCIGLARYKSGMTVGFVVLPDLTWSLAVVETPRAWKKGDRVGVAFQIDGGPVHEASARAIQPRGLFIPLADSDSLFQEFRLGTLLRISLGGQISSFRLDGTAAMLNVLLACAERYRQLPPVTAAAPPAPGGRGDKPVRGSAPAPKSVSTGSGFFVSGDGAVLTNAHVVEGCEDATVAGFGKARILARDSVNDLALLKMAEGVATSPARLRRKPLQLGETVYALGFPLAGQLDNGLNFTSGIVSSLAGPGNDTRALQFTAPIQAGNSGGPIVDGAGLVVGVTQAKLSEVAAIKDGQPFPQNVNFGIKADLAANFLRANSVEPGSRDEGEPVPAVNIARDGRAYTVQVKCTPN